MRAAVLCSRFGRRLIGHDYLHIAYEQAVRSNEDDDLPIGGAMTENDAIIGIGHNRRRTATRSSTARWIASARPVGGDYVGVTRCTTLSPCMVCSGTIVQFGIKSVVIGEARNFPGNIEFLRQHSVGVVVLDDPDCIELMARFIRERPDLWYEDIAGRDNL